MFRTTINFYLVLIVVAIFGLQLISIPSGIAAPPAPRESKQGGSAPVEHKLEHFLSLDDAINEARSFSTPVIGFGYSNPTVTGAFMPSAAYPKDKFLAEFQAEHGTVPQVDAFLTSPGTIDDYKKAMAKKVSVTSPPFKAPSPPRRGSKTQQELSRPLAGDQSVSLRSQDSALSWFPVESEVRTYQNDGNAVLQSSYKWNQTSGGSIGNLDAAFGLEVEVNLESDFTYHGSRPGCYRLTEEPVDIDSVRKNFWAQNQNWSSWWVATQFAQTPEGASMEPYADYNDLGDSCNRQSLAVGIGKPRNMPGQGQATYGLRVSVVAPLGNVSDNHIYRAGLQPVHYDCDLPPWYSPAHSDCMAAYQTPYPNQDENYFPSLAENGAAYPSDPLTRVPVHTPGACWSLVSGAVPQRIDCVYYSGVDAYNLAGWGGNYAGELGRGDDNVVPVPSQIALGALQGVNISQMSSNAVGYTNCAVAAAELWCWGENNYGSLGNGTYTDSFTPVKVDMTGAMAGTVITQVQTSQGSTCAIASGKPFCWGAWQINGINDYSAVPVAIDTTGVLAGKTVTDLALTNNTACVVADGRPYCWGSGGSGQLGNATMAFAQYPVAVDVSGALAGRVVTEVAAVGIRTMCALAEAKAYCWGDNYYGELGNGTKVNSSVPVSVGGPLATRNVTALSDGYSPCAIADGAAYCWGKGNGGLLGTGVVYDYWAGPNEELLPRAVDASGVLAGKTVTHIAQGDAQTCVLASGQPYCWGQNYDGQLGNDFDPSGTAWSPLPVQTAGTVLEGKTMVGLTAGGGATIVQYEP